MRATNRLKSAKYTSADSPSNKVAMSHVCEVIFTRRILCSAQINAGSSKELCKGMANSGLVLRSTHTNQKPLPLEPQALPLQSMSHTHTDQKPLSLEPTQALPLQSMSHTHTDQKPLPLEPQALPLQSMSHTHTDPSKPLVVLLPWLNAKEKHVSKFVSLYRSKGCDVVISQITASPFLWPQKAFKVTDGLCAQLRTPDYRTKPLIFHSLSVGSYLLSVLFLQMLEQPQSYHDISSRAVAFISDSITVGSTMHMANGLMSSLTNNMAAHLLGKASILSYFTLTYPWTVRLYNRFIDAWYKYPLRHAPMLYYYSMNDPMCHPATMKALIADQQSRGYDIWEKSWEKSAHTAHLVWHTEEYIQTLDEFLKHVSIKFAPQDRSEKPVLSKL